MTISEEFVDSDLVPPDGIGAGLIEQDPEAFASSVLCGDIESASDVRLLERSEYQAWAIRAERLLRGSVRGILNQGREGSCVAFSTVAAMQIAGILQFGDRMPELSPMSLYERIGRSASSGAMIPDGVNEATDRGVLPAYNEPNQAEFDLTYPMTGFNPRRLKRLDWEPTAKLFRVARVLRVGTVRGWITSLVNGWPIVYGRRGHALCSLFPKFEKGRLFFGYINSWGAWGDPVNPEAGNGLGWDSERTIDNCVGYAIQGLVRREGGAQWL